MATYYTLAFSFISMNEMLSHYVTIFSKWCHTVTLLHKSCNLVPYDVTPVIFCRHTAVTGVTPFYFFSSIQARYSPINTLRLIEKTRT